MSGLYVTPTRRYWLSAVKNGRVYREAGQAWDYDTGHKLTARMDELVEAGWVEVGPEVRPDKRVYVLTPAGAALAGGSGSEGGG